MLIQSLIYALHLLCALIWVGGMFFAWMILRPAAATLPPPARLPLWSAVLAGFFRWVWLAVVILPLSGFAMLHLRQQGLDSAAHFIQVMIGLYLVMLSLFLRAQLLAFPELRNAVNTQDWITAASALAKIRRLAGFNLLIGLTLVCLAAVRPAL